MDFFLFNFFVIDSGIYSMLSEINLRITTPFYQLFFLAWTEYIMFIIIVIRFSLCFDLFLLWTLSFPVEFPVNVF